MTIGVYSTLPPALDYESMRYTSAFGVYEIPPDVYSRSIRLKALHKRDGYLDEWCRWQWQKSFDK